jgi:spore germination protein KC
LSKSKKKTIACLLSVLLIVFAGGCWDLMDINKKLIITSIAFDYKDGETFFYVEIANVEAGNTGEKGSKGGSKYTVFKARGQTLPGVRENLEAQMHYPIYLSGVRALIFTESFANKYMYEYLYRLRADEAYRKKAITFVTREDPEALFEIANGNDVSLGTYVEEIIKSMESAGSTFTRTTSRIIENLSNTNPVFLMHCVGTQNGQIIFTEYAVFSQDRVAGYLPAGEAAGVVCFKADKMESVYIVPYKEFQFTVRAEMKKRKIEPHYEDGRIAFNLKFDFEASLLYGDKRMPYGIDDAAAKDMQGILAGMIQKDIAEAVMRAQKEFGCDYLQLHDAFRIKYPAVFKRLDWSQAFPNIGINVEVRVRLESVWDMDYSVNEGK